MSLCVVICKAVNMKGLLVDYNHFLHLLIKLISGFIHEHSFIHSFDNMYKLNL
jgi:hypothetical protein